MYMNIHIIHVYMYILACIHSYMVDYIYGRLCVCCEVTAMQGGNSTRSRSILYNQLLYSHVRKSLCLGLFLIVLPIIRVCMSCLFVCLSLCLSFCLVVCLHVRVSVLLRLCPSASLSFNVPVSLCPRVSVSSTYKRQWRKKSRPTVYLTRSDV